jgi:hypothetical protein
VLTEGGVKIVEKGNEVKSNYDKCFDEVENDIATNNEKVKPFIFTYFDDQMDDIMNSNEMV